MFIYLASPYSHSNPEVRQSRYEAVRDLVGRLTLQHLTVYSPIVYHHYTGIQCKLPTDADFWWNNNRAMMDSASSLYVYRMPGWEDSLGVMQEIEYARVTGKTITFLG